MAVTPRLDLKLKQSLLMTPQLKQAINLLQMSNNELSEYLAEELEKNPLLETEDETFDRVDLKETPKEKSETEENNYNEDNKEVPLDIDYEYADSDLSLSSWQERSYNKNFDNIGGENILEQTIADKISFKDYIIEQINLAFINNADRIIAVNLLDMLDASGYLVGDTKEIEKKSMRLLV